jgi:hypothetical protein
MLVSVLPWCNAKLDNFIFSLKAVDKSWVVPDLSTALLLDSPGKLKIRIFAVQDHFSTGV